MFDPKSCLNKRAGTSSSILWADAYQAVKDAYQAGLKEASEPSDDFVEVVVRQKYGLNRREFAVLNAIATFHGPYCPSTKINWLIDQSPQSRMPSTMVCLINKKVGRKIIENLPWSGYYLNEDGKAFWQEALASQSRAA